MTIYIKMQLIIYKDTNISPSVSIYYEFRTEDNHEINRVLNTISGRMQNVLTLTQIKMSCTYLDIYSLILVKIPLSY